MYFYFLQHHDHNNMCAAVQQLMFVTGQSDLCQPVLDRHSRKADIYKSIVLCDLDTVGVYLLHAEAGLASLRQKGALVLELMCNQPSWSLEEAGSPAEEQQGNVQQIQAVMEEMQLRKQR